MTSTSPLIIDQHVRSYASLRAEGASRRQIDEAVARADVRRVARGWYGFPDADPRIVRPLQANTRATCITGGALHGLWVPDSADLHVAVPKGAPAPIARGMVGHRLAETGYRTPHAVMPVTHCLHDLLTCLDRESALIALEDAVARKVISPRQASRLIASLPPTTQYDLRFFDPASGSGTETRVRLLFQSARIRVRSQVQIPGVGRVDLLVGESLIIECDSRLHHTSYPNYQYDRHRDLGALVRGYTIIRLTWEQVFCRWPETSRALLGLVRARPDALCPVLAASPLRAA